MPSSSRPQATSHPSTFQTRTATDDAGELNRRFSVLDPQSSPSPPERPPRDQHRSSNRDHTPNPYDPATNDSTPPPRRHSLTKRLLHIHRDGSNESGSGSPSGIRNRSASTRRKSRVPGHLGEESLTNHVHNPSGDKKANGDASNPKPGLGPRPIGGNEKLGTFSGVFVPTCLNVLSILMFLRFGFILGQGGVVGILGRIQPLTLLICGVRLIFDMQECLLFRILST